MGPRWGGRSARTSRVGGRPVAAPAPLTLSRLSSYGRVYAAADPYHHTIGPAATYSIGTMVRSLGGLALGTIHEAAAGAGGQEALRVTTQTSGQCIGPGGQKDHGLDSSWRWGDLPLCALMELEGGSSAQMVSCPVVTSGPLGSPGVALFSEPGNQVLTGPFLPNQ